MVFCRSQSGEKSRPCSCSLSPCLKNSSMHLSSTSTLEIQKSPSWFFPDHKTQKIPPVRTLWSTGCAAATSLQGGRRRKSEEALRGLAVCPSWWTHEYDYCRCIFTTFKFSINEDDYMVMSHLPLSTLEAATRFFIDFNWEKCIDMSERKFLYLPEMSINPSPSPTIYVNQYINTWKYMVRWQSIC